MNNGIFRCVQRLCHLPSAGGCVLFRPVSTHPPQTEVLESNVDDPHHVLAPNNGKTLQRADITIVQYLLVNM